MRDPVSGWLQVSSVEFFLVWTAMGLGETPVPLEVSHLGRIPAARAELAEGASRALAARDLGTVHEPARDLAQVLRQLAAGGVSLDLRVLGQGSPLLGYATTGDRGAAVAARVDGEVRMGAVRPTAVASALLDSLPASPAGSGRPANIAVADYDAACEEAEREGVNGFVRVLHTAGVRQPEASMLAHALTTRTGGGQLGVTGRGRALVTWLDAEDGRYALRQHGAWLTVTPADVPRLTSMTEEMLADVQ